MPTSWNWGQGIELEVGDRLEVEICKAENVDAPEAAYPEDEQRTEAKLKEQFEYARQVYFQFRERFEGGDDAASCERKGAGA